MIYPPHHSAESGNVSDKPNLIKFLAGFRTVLWKDWSRDMQCRMLDDRSFSLSGTCPHCHSKAVFLPVTNPHEEEFDNIFHRELYAGMQCQGCGDFVLGCVVKSAEYGTWEYKLHYPLRMPDDRVADEIPSHIASDFREALRCRWVNAYNATAEMCRRALEASCVGLGAPAKAKQLINKIDWLEEQRKITLFLRDVAHKIRLGGNRGAHPSEDEPPITDEHADAIIKFTREFFHHVYVVPSELQKYDFSKS